MSKNAIKGVTKEIEELINIVARRTMQEARAEMLPPQDVNYYRIVERILQNYKTYLRILQDEEAYIQQEPEYAGRSADIVIRGSNGGPVGAAADEARETARHKAYRQTAEQFAEIDKVVKQFMQRREFIVVAMYYMNEDADGNDRGADAKRYTWWEIEEELSNRGILQSEKTARRWRSSIINDMAFCLFGVKAAVAESVHSANWERNNIQPAN